MRGEVKVYVWERARRSRKMVVAGVGVEMFIERRMTEEMDNW